MARAPWPRYPEFVPARLLQGLAEWFRWPAEGILETWVNGQSAYVFGAGATSARAGRLVTRNRG